MFTIGAIVQLKSGGPAMTVAGNEADAVICMWFDAALVLQSASFTAEVLKRMRAKR